MVRMVIMVVSYVNDHAKVMALFAIMEGIDIEGFISSDAAGKVVQENQVTSLACSRPGIF